jgi:hypothetical protein
MGRTDHAYPRAPSGADRGAPRDSFQVAPVVSHGGQAHGDGASPRPEPRPSSHGGGQPTGSMPHWPIQAIAASDPCRERPAAANEIRSLHRVVKLRTPPPDGISRQVLLIPEGATDEEVLGWAAEVLDDASMVELRKILRAQSQTGPAGHSPP